MDFLLSIIDNRIFLNLLAAAVGVGMVLFTVRAFMIERAERLKLKNEKETKQEKLAKLR